MELSHPRGTGLDDLKLHIVFVAEAVGHADGIAGFEVGRFDEAQRDVFVAICLNAIPMFFDHLGELLIWGDSTPLELFSPLAKELASPELGGVGPKMTEGFFEQIGFEQTPISR